MSKILRRSAAYAAALFMLLASTLPAGAFEVSPMRAELSPTGSRASTVISVRNSLAEPLAIEVYTTERFVAEDGSQTFEPNEEDFLIFPPQAFIQPGASQGFRVQYIGDPALETTRSYVVNVSQVPVKQIEGAGVQVVYRFGAAVYVHPKDSATALSVADIKANDGSVTVRISNEGDRMAFLYNDRMTLTTPGGVTNYDSVELKNLVKNPLVPPKSTRVFTFDAPGVKPGSSVSAVLYPRDD